MGVIEEIKAKIDMRIYVSDDLGKPKNVDGIWYFQCPTGHKDNSPSFAVYADHAHCYQCGWHGDVINYVELRTGKTGHEARDFLTEDADLPRYEPKFQPEAKLEVSLTLTDAERYHFNVGLVKPYLESRKISESVINQCLMGGSDYQSRNPAKIKYNHKTYVDMEQRSYRFECNWVALPYLFGDQVYSMNFRRDDQSCWNALKKLSGARGMDMFEYIRTDLALKAGKLPHDIKDEAVMLHCFGPRFYRPNTPVTAYGVHNLVYRDGTKLVYPHRPYCLITEGEFNQLSCECESYTCLALKATKGVDVARLLQNVRMVLVVVDPDEAGEKYANMILASLGNDSTKARKVVMPKGFKDMNDLRRVDALGDFLSRKPYYLEPFIPVSIPF